MTSPLFTALSCLFICFKSEYSVEINLKRRSFNLSMEFCQGCRELEEENMRLKSLIQQVKDLLLDNSTASTTLKVQNVLTSAPSPSSLGPVLAGGDSPLLTCDFAPNAASSPLLFQCGQDLNDETFYEPAEQLAALKDEVSIIQGELDPKDPDTTFCEPAADQDAAQKKENVHPRSPILGVGIARRARRRILCDTEEQEKPASALGTSYDRLPQLKEPNYRYKKEAVRGAKRKQVPGHDCNRCEEYYVAAKLGKNAIKKCSRHRAQYSPVRSPKGFWSLNMPSTQWIRAKASGEPVSPFKW